MKQDISASLPFLALSNNWYKCQAREAENIANLDLAVKSATRVEEFTSSVLLFPCMSAKWYEKQRDNQEKKRDEEKKSSLPFQRLSRKWYTKRGKLFGKNRSRKEDKKSREERECLEKSVLNLETKLKEYKLSDNSKKECTAILEIGKYLIANGPLVPAQEISKVYRSKQNQGKRRLRSSELILKKLKKDFNVIKFVICGSAYIVENIYPYIDDLTTRKNVNDYIRNIELVRT